MRLPVGFLYIYISVSARFAGVKSHDLFYLSVLLELLSC